VPAQEHSFSRNKNLFPLGSVDVHFMRITVAAREMKALKLSSVLQ
jgi:hypothetical protein